MNALILYFLTPFLISVLAIPFLIAFSKKKNILDISSGDVLKIHKNPVPLLGGLAIFISTGIVFLALGFADSRYLYIILGGLAVFLLGLWDDLKWKHVSSRKPHLKFLFLIIVSFLSALALYLGGVKFFVFPWLSFFYIFVMINAVNYQDGMDGQAGVAVLISMAGFCAMSFLSGNNFATTASLVFSGAILGFLAYNFPPAKIFMGDSGAYLLGFAMAALSVIFSENILSHLFMLGLPLFDGVLINLKRVLGKKSIFLGDREHFYDKLLNKGFSARKTILISSLLQVAFIVLGLIFYIYA